MSFKSFVNIFESVPNSTLQKIESLIKEIGPDVELFVVGGAVRDKLLGVQSKDIDFVVTKMPYAKAEDAIKSIHKALQPLADSVNMVGASFGIVTATIDGEDFDFAIPRSKETKTGDGHSDFTVDLDPQASIETDLARRDFTINAMAQSINGDIVDPLGGRKDIQEGLIRAVGNADARFKEDPLRMVRAIQFASRLSTVDGKPFRVEDDTLKAIAKNASSIKGNISGERILAEFEKAWTKGRANIDTFLDLLKDTGIGKDLFGSEFNPKPVTISGTSEDQKIARFVGMFSNGGEQKFLALHKGLPTEYTDHLNVFRNIIKGDKEPWQFIGSHKNKIPLLTKIAQALKSVYGEEPISMSRKMMQVPILPKDLAIDGMELMNFGFKGKEIGEAQRKALSALWHGKIHNKKEDIVRLLGKEKSEP